MIMKTEVDATPFTDVLFNLILGITFMFVVSFMLIRPLVKAKDISTQAEFIVTVTWPIKNADDVDTWMEDPLGNVVWYSNKEKGLMHLDRDDLGYLNDVVYLPDGTRVEYPHNQEILTIRGFVPGEWILNVHMYSKRDSNPTPVHITVDKLNPVFQTVLVKDVILSKRWDEETIGRFEMSTEGKIISIDDLPKQLIKTKG